MGFKSSQQLGKEAEDFVIKLFTRHKYEVSRNEDKDTRSEYDLAVSISPKKKVYIEVKLDKMAAQTQNLCIEYYNPKTQKDSGINITKANIYSYTLLDDGNHTVWFSNVNKLKDYLKNTKPKKVINKGGDNNASLYLYPVEKILADVFVRMENLADEETFHKLFKELYTK